MGDLNPNEGRWVVQWGEVAKLPDQPHHPVVNQRRPVKILAPLDDAVTDTDDVCVFKTGSNFLEQFEHQFQCGGVVRDGLREVNFGEGIPVVQVP